MSTELKDYEVKIDKCYKLDARARLGRGSFGVIYLGVNINLNQKVAIKIEPIETKNPRLFYEYKIYNDLYGGDGIPEIHWYGSQGNCNILIMSLLGRSLEFFLNYCDRKFTLLTTLMIINKMLARIEFIHSRGYIHRDIKPDNFLMGRHLQEEEVYLIDFGLAKRYIDKSTGMHIQSTNGNHLIGTATYSSINAHLGTEQSRRDDIESLGYILVYFMKGKLPWKGLKARTKKEKYEKIKQKKISTSLDSLCQGLPDDFKKFIQHARDLKFEDKPDYSYLKDLIIQMREKNKLKFDYGKLDWLVKAEGELKKLEESKKDNIQKEKEKEEEEYIYY